MHNRAAERSAKGASEGSFLARARKRNGKSRTGTSAEGTSSIERRVAEKKWPEARSQIQEELVYAPTDHWLWTTLGLIYYEEKNYVKALKCSEYAVQLAPSCPLVLWDYAGALFMTGHESSALAVWTVLLNTDLDTVAYGDHGEGMSWALQLVNDTQYRIGRYYQWAGEPRLARESYLKYLHNRKHGVGSIYDAGAVEQYLAQLPEDGTTP
jgi:tetratricopeptide (TPR) repeat protein